MNFVHTQIPQHTSGLLYHGSLKLSITTWLCLWRGVTQTIHSTGNSGNLALKTSVTLKYKQTCCHKYVYKHMLINMSIFITQYIQFQYWTPTSMHHGPTSSCAGWLMAAWLLSLSLSGEFVLLVVIPNSSPADFDGMSRWIWSTGKFGLGDTIP